MYVCMYVQCRQLERKTRSTIFEHPTADLLFVIAYNVVQEVISSFSKNDNTLVLIVPAVNRGIPYFGTLRCHAKSSWFNNDSVST